MTYTTDWRIVSQGQSTAAEITAYYKANAQSGLNYVNGLRADRRRREGLTVDDLPPLPLNPIPDDIGETIIAASQAFGPDYTVNHDGLAVQGGKESAFLQSEIARDKMNPSGLGASNDDPYENAITCTSWIEGFTLTVAHLLSYAVGDGPWAKVDPRWKYMTIASRGTRKRWVDLNGYWAVPGKGYGQSIIQRTNDDLLKVEVDDMAAQIPGFAWQPADDKHYSKGRQAQRIKGFAVHYTGGTNSLPWLTTTSQPPVSAHFLIKHNPTMEDRGWQLVRIEDTAWTTGSPTNDFAVSFEYEHKVTQGIPDVAYQVMAATIRDVAAYVKARGLGEIPFTREAIKGHKEWVGDNRVCPDGIEVDRIVGLLTGGGPVDETAREINGYTVRGAFLAAYQQLELDGAHWWTFGLPTGADVPGVMVDGIERTVQPFDRAGWVMSEGGGVVVAKPAQAKQINAALGIETGADVRVAAVREAARAARDQIDVILSEVAD